VAVAHEYVWSRDNGWDFTVSACLRFLDEHVADEPPVASSRHPLTLARDEIEGAQPLARDAGAPDYAEHVALLGQATAELHLALADGRGDPSFEPAPLTARDLAGVGSRIRARLRSAQPALKRIAAGEDARAAEQARAVLGLGERLGGWLAETRRAAGGVAKIRVHGDYHLGQVLEVEGRFVILDFEGEVGMPIEQRREQASAFADLAGMLRSFSYAGLTARATQALNYPESEQALERLSGWVAWWEEHAVASFLAAYLQAAEGAPFLPQDAEQSRRLLDLYLLDKALHELRYELEHRPDWAGIPLEGLARIAAHIEAPPAEGGTG
ncbi:MAG: hypothetical protein WD800_00700, partial [Dehalococcoidia bacterium]